MRRALKNFKMAKIRWGKAQENLSSGFPTRSYLNQPAQLDRQARKLKFHLLQVLI